MRRIIKQLFAAALYYSGLLALLDYFALVVTGKPHEVLLMYHRVLDDPFSEFEYAQTGTAVSTKSFEAQIAFLAKKFTVLTAAEYVRRRKSGTPLPKKCAVVTFDDGWADNYENAYPVLKQYKVPATIFLCSDFVDSTKKFWFHEMIHAIKWQNLSAEQLEQALNRFHSQAPAGDSQPVSLSTHTTWNALINSFFRLAKTLSADQLGVLLADLTRITGKSDDAWQSKRFILSWDEIAAMDPAIIEIGSHGKSHRLLTAISRDESARELIESKRDIEEKLGRKVLTFAYPNGSYDETIKQMTAEAGYDGAFGVGFDHLDSDLFAVSRSGVHEGAIAGFRGKFSPAIWAAKLSPAYQLWFDKRKGPEEKVNNRNNAHYAIDVF